MKDLADYVTEEWKKSETIKTHEVIDNTGEIQFQGTKDACDIWLAANAPLGTILGFKYKKRKIK